MYTKESIPENSGAELQPLDTWDFSLYLAVYLHMFSAEDTSDVFKFFKDFILASF